MKLAAVAQFLAEQKQPAFRLSQVKRAFYVEGITSWDGLSTWPKALRDEATKTITWDALKPLKTQVSSKGDTVKTLFELEDGKKVETVIMRHEGGRNTVCISSQVGCAMACTFCATGTMGLNRNLTSDEIAEQVVQMRRWLKENGDAHVTNVVYMGMGEPFNNYDEVMKSVRTLNDHEGINLGARHISISTCGLVPGILRLADEQIQVNLAISLHSAVNATRSKIMPVNKAFPVEKLMAAIETYTRKTNRKVFFEYLMLKDLNDTEEEAEALIKLLEKDRRLYHINLIKYHDTDAFTSTATPARIRFMHLLQRAGISVTHRITFGEDIDAACGQLAINEQSGQLKEGIQAAKAGRAEKQARAAAKG